MQILSRDFFFFNYTATTEIYTYGHTLSLHDALPISTSSTMTASAMRRYSGFTRWAKRAPICAPVTLPSNSSPASTISTAPVDNAWTIVAAIVTNNIWNSEVPTTI